MRSRRLGIAFVLALFALVFPTVSRAQSPYPLQWPLWSSDANDADVDATEAWGLDTMGEDVTVGVIDQSVDATHPKFAGHIDEGVNFVDPGTECGKGTPTGEDDHGTLVAGLIVAQPDGRGLVAGLAPNARVRPIRTMNDCGESTVKATVQGIRYAGERDLPIAVMSFASDPLEPAETKAKMAAGLEAAFREAGDVLFVVAAGNAGNDNDEPGHEVYPCSSEAENVLCVGMTGASIPGMSLYRSDKPACWGNVGQYSVDLFAPGIGIPSTARPGGGFATGSGTSMAAPLVAATAALLKARSAENLGPEQLKAAILQGVDKHDELLPVSVSGGRLNAARALDPNAFLGRSGVSGKWSSCDQDHDGVLDHIDNCRSAPNRFQEDSDGDGIGDACDPDRDGDRVLNADDGCPDLYSLTATGCPDPVVVDPPPPPPGGGDEPQQPRLTPTPTPVPTPSPTPTPTPAPKAIQVLKVNVTKARAAKVTIRLSRTAKVSLRIERKRGRAWKRVGPAKSVTATMSVKSLTLRPGGKKLPKGSYRLTATVAGGEQRFKTFRVR